MSTVKRSRRVRRNETINTQAPAPAAGRSSEKHQALSVLLIEDMPTEVELVRAALDSGPTRFELVHASSWDAFLAGATGMPDVILTDFYLGAFTAPDVIHALQERRIDRPVIVVSGAIGDEAAAECIKLGAADYLSKTRLSVLPDTVLHVLNMHRLREEQRDAAEQLRRSHALLRMASRIGRVGGWSVDLPNRTLTWSEEVCAIHEVPPDFTPTVERALSFYSPASEPLIRAAFEQCVCQGQAFDLELELTTATGRSVWVRAIGEPERDHSGAVCRVQGAFQDISAQKQAALEARQIADRLTSTLESITDAFFTVDRDWRFTYVNSQAERLLQRSRTHLLGRKIWDEFPEARDSAFHRNYERALRDNVSVHFEEYYAPIDLWADVRVYPSSQGLAVYFRDNTQTRRVAQVLRESEQRYRLLFNATPHPIWVEDAASRRLLAANDKAVELYGYTRDQLLQMSADEFAPHPGSTSETGSKDARFDLAVRHSLRDGRVIWVKLTSHDLEFERRQAKLVLVQDVTARRAAELALRESERRFRELAENVQDVFYNYDAVTGNALYVSPAYEEVWGRTCEDLYAHPGSFADAIHPEDRGVFNQAHELNLQGMPADIIYRIFRPNGDLRWIRDRSYAITDAAGRIERIVGVARDITEQHVASEVLRQSEERLRMLIEGVTDYAIFLLDAAGTIASWNQGAERIFGFSGAEIIGQTHGLLFDTDNPPSVDPDTLLETARTAGRAQAEGWQTRKDGTRFWASVVVTALRAESGELRGFSKITRDISERKAYEVKLAQQAALLDQASDAILVRDMNHVVRFWSKGAERLYGWKSGEACGTAVASLIYASMEGFDAAMQALLRDGSWSGELEQRTKTRRSVTVQGRWTLLRDARGQPESVLVINSDVTDQKIKEAQFYRAQRVESIGTLAGGIAHDLNNILAPITIGVGILKRLELAEGDTRVVDAIERSAERGAHLVRQILSFARGLDGQRIDLNLRHVVNEVQMMMADTFPKNITLDVEIAHDTWMVTGDPTQLTQVLLNLCVNARDAMPTGGNLSISVENQVLDEQFASAVHEASAGNYVVLSVKDTGTGMSREVIEHIFEPFFTTKAVGKGTGFGLSTALGITKAHGGFVTVQSDVGHGSIFKVHLPANVRATPPANVPLETSDLPRGRGEWILVVDDEPAIRVTTKQTLERFGYNVLLAEDGATAIAAFARQSETIALTITDLVMPIMDGVSLVTALLRIAPEALVIGATGAGSEQEVQRFQAAGVKRLIPKPFSAAALLTAARAVLDAASPERRGISN